MDLSSLKIFNLSRLECFDNIIIAFFKSAWGCLSLQPQTYKEYASAIVDTYPRTGAMLRRIAHSYESDAHQEEIRSELEDW